MYKGTKTREQIRLLSAILMIRFYEQENKMLTGRIKVSAVCDLFMSHFSLASHLDKVSKGCYEFTYS